MLRLGAYAVTVAKVALAVAAAQPVFSAGGPDAAGYGQALGYPAAQLGQQVNSQPYMVGSYSHYDAVFPAHTVAKAPNPSPWRRSPQELTLSYSFRGAVYTVQDYLDRNPATGLLIARGDTILFEHYQYGRTDGDRFLSHSMAKTVTAMLIGIALAEGAIHSIDDPASRYVPELTGSELGATPLRALLHMASGTAFTEVYDGHDDNAALGRALFGRAGPGPVAAVMAFNSRIAPPDTLWHYASVNTEVLGLALARATGQSLADYLQSRIWQKMGAEADAKWTVDNTGQEIGYCCLNATLRDYARFGRLLAEGGAAGGQQIIPRQWIMDATARPEPGSALASSGPGFGWGYGYQTWLLPGSRHDFALEGIHGQRVFIDPQAGLVLVQTAVRVAPSHNPGDNELVALWNSLVQQEAGR